MAKGVTIDLIVDPSGAVKGLKTASDESSKATDFFKGLGQVGATAVAAVATAAVAAAGALTAATVSAAAYADEILTAATNTNLSTEELQAYRYAAELMDVSFETFVKSQGKFTKSMNDATEGTGPAAEGFAALGLSVTDANGNLLDSTELYWQAIDALGEIENETERTAIAQEIFGKSGAEMNSIIAKGSEGFAELTEEARKNGAIMSGEQLEKLGAFDDKMQSLTSTVEAAKNALGLTLLPVLDDLAGSGTNALGEFTTALLDADGDLTKAGPAFESLGTNIASALTTAIPKILEVATSLVSGLLSGIVANAPTLIQAAIPLLVSFVTGILSMLPTILYAGIKILIAVVQGITQALPTLIPAAIQAVLGLVDALLANLPELITAGIQLLLALALGLIEALPELVAYIPTIITEVITALVGAIPELVMAGVQLFLALVQNLPAIIGGIIEAVPQIIDALFKAFTDPKFWEQMAQAGTMLIEGLWQGISRMADWLWRQISGFFGDVIDNIKDLFGIASPSKLFADFGGYMVQGLEVGLSGPNHLSQITGDLARQVTSGFGASLNVRAQAALGISDVGSNAEGATGGVPQVNQTIYMLPEQDPRILGRQFGREFARTMAGVA